MAAEGYDTLVTHIDATEVGNRYCAFVTLMAGVQVGQLSASMKVARVVFR